MPILQDEIWRKTQKLLVAGRMRSTLFGYISICKIKNSLEDFIHLCYNIIKNFGAKEKI